MKILVTDDVHPIMVKKFLEEEFECDQRTDIDQESLLSVIDEYDGLVVRSKIVLDEYFISRCHRLKCIGRVGAGMETIAVDFAESRGIRCFNSPEGNRDAVGEHATALLLALFNKIAQGDFEVRRGMWRREANRGLEVKGKTVGIVGFGNMGAAFAQRLQGFECNIVAYDKYKTDYAPHYVEECESLEELQSMADVVSFHVPLTQETRHLMDESFVSDCAKPFYLLNTSRGAVVDTRALAQGMRDGKILGAGLDVLEYENMVSDAIDVDSMPDDFKFLVNSPQTVFTPHVGGWTVESKYKLAAVLANKMINCLKERDENE